MLGHCTLPGTIVEYVHGTYDKRGLNQLFSGYVSTISNTLRINSKANRPKKPSQNQLCPVKCNLAYMFVFVGWKCSLMDTAVTCGKNVFIWNKQSVFILSWAVSTVSWYVYEMFMYRYLIEQEYFVWDCAGEQAYLIQGTKIFQYCTCPAGRVTYNFHSSCKNIHLSLKSIFNKEHKGVICNMTSSSNSF